MRMKRIITTALMTALVMAILPLLIPEMNVSASYYNYWDDADDSVPTEIIEEETIDVDILGDGTVCSFVFTPKKSGPYLFYGDVIYHEDDRAGLTGRVRTIDSKTGEVKCEYEPMYGIKHGGPNFTIRINAVEGRKYFLDAKISWKQDSSVPCELTVEEDSYTAVVYKPKNRIELLYNEDGELIEYSGGSEFFNYEIMYDHFLESQGQFEFTKTDGSKEIYKYTESLDWSNYYKEFRCNGKTLNINENWTYISNQSLENQWDIGQHEFTIYIDGKKLTVPVWVVSEYSDFDDSDEGNSPSSGNNQGNTFNTFTVKYDSTGGTKVSNQTKRKGVILKLSTAIPKHKNKIFLGWATSKNGKVVYKPGSFYSADKNITLYAKWRSGETSKSNISTTGLKKAKKKYAKLKTMLAKGTYVIPGLNKSCVKTDDGKYLAECSHMVPQGICTAKGNIFITAYCSKKEHNSVIHVLNAKNGKYKGTVTLQDKNHCGGVTYDGKGYLWIAKSTSGKVSAIKAKKISDKAKKDDAPLVKYDKTLVCYNGNGKSCNKIKSASFVTYDEGKLWVGYCAKNSKKATLYGYVIKYKSGKPSSLQYKQAWPISTHANGAVFVKKSGKKYLIVSSEAGRKTNSKLISYLANDNGKTCSFKKKKTVTLPPLHEELDVGGDKILSIYESGAKEYRGNVKNGAVMGVVCVGNKTQILKMLNIK